MWFSRMSLDSRDILNWSKVRQMMVKNEQVNDRRVGFTDGSSRLLSELWRKQPLVLVFLRHLG